MLYSQRITQAQSAYLDFVRALAAMAVLFGHGAEIFLKDSFLAHANFQSVGVLVFFLLSGFLISYSVFRKHDDPDYGFKDFFIDRFCRIYCAFIPALIFVWLVDLQTIKIPLEITTERLSEIPYMDLKAQSMGVITWLGNLFMMQDFPIFQILRTLGVPDNSFFISVYGSAGPFWTISIEWWLYMLFGVSAIIYVKNKTPLKITHLPLLGFIAIVPAYFAVGGTNNCLSLLWALGMIACMLFLRMGPWATMKGIPSKRWLQAWITVFVTSLVFMAARLVSIKLDTGSYNFTEFQFSLYMASALFSLFFVFGLIEQVPALFKKTLAFFADYSFSLYLIHFTILTYIYHLMPGNDHDAATFWIAMVSSNLVAIIFWWLFERHHKNLSAMMKKRLHSS